MPTRPMVLIFFQADKLLQALHKYAAAQSDSAISGPESDTAESASETETESTDQSAEPSSQQVCKIASSSTSS